MIEKIESKGYYIDQCRLEGETKADDHVPAQHNTLQMSQNRWFVIYETRTFRGSDDNRSVVYQVRKDTPDGPVLSEGCLDKSDQDWDPLGDGSHYVKLCNHSVVFGVPQGAVINGKRAAHGGYFAASWRANPRVLDRQRDYLLHETEEVLPPESYRDYWVQFKLNETEDDIEIISPVAPLRQKGYEEGPAVCRHEEFVQMNQSYVVPVPYNGDCTEWAFLLHWGGGLHTLKSACTAILYRWNDTIKRYEWVETGPILDGPNGMGIFEGAILPYKNGWLVSARITQRNYLGNVWFRTNDLFGADPEPVYSDSVKSICPRTTFCFPDGIVRVCTTDQEKSPYNHLTDVRIPLDIMDIDPDDNYRVTNSAVVFDSIKEGLPIKVESAPTIHFCRLLPHTGGNKGKLTYFVRPRGLKHPLTAGRNKGLLKREDMLISGVYYSEITYDNEFAPTWQFDANSMPEDRINTSSFMKYTSVIAFPLFLVAFAFLLMPPARLAGEGNLPLFKTLKTEGYGDLSGRVQTLLMGRKFENHGAGDTELHSGTIAISLNYQSPAYKGISVGGEYMYSWKLLSTGDRLAFGNLDPAYVLSNSDFSILNKAYIRLTLDDLGWKNSYLKVGRQALHTVFAGTYNIRQKDQSYEAVLLHVENNQNFSADLGFIDKFSSWTSRDDLTNGPSANGFNPVEKVEGVPYSTNGMPFFEVTYTGIERAELTLYDFYGDDLYNTFGLNIMGTVIDSDTFKTDIKIKYIRQRGLDRYDDFTGFDLRSDALQGGVNFQKGDFRIEPGFFIVTGGGADNDIHSPFQPSLIIEEPMVETDAGFFGGSQSFYVESNYAWNSNNLYILYLHTDLHSSNPVDKSKELDIIYTRNLGSRYYFKLKMGFVDYDGVNTGTEKILDYQIFLGWNL